MTNAKTKSVTDTPRAAYWRGLVDKWQASGQTPEAFCRQRHVNVVTYGLERRPAAFLLGDSPA